MSRVKSPTEIAAMIGINIFSFVALYLSTKKKNPNVKLATIFGLCGQPCWWITMYCADQWALIPANLLFTSLWIKNLHVHWIDDSVWFNKFKWVKEIKAVGFKDWFWFVFQIKRNEFHWKLNFDLNVEDHKKETDRVIKDRDRAHHIDLKLQNIK